MKENNSSAEVEIITSTPPASCATTPVSSSTSTLTAAIGADVKEGGRKTRSYSTPGEDKLRKEILELTQDIAHSTTKRNTGLANVSQLEELNAKIKELKTKEGSLKNLLNNRERQTRKRDRDKKIFDENPELAAKFKRKSEIGRPRCEVDQPELLQTIMNIAMFGARADERRRSETLRSIKTLDELTSKLHDEGFKISRSAVYLRLLPKRSNSIEGKRHVTTVPVRLCRASNDLHRDHSDTLFCRATIRYLEEIASILGPDQVLFISQDDKARVPIGITAAHKQAPMLMHVDYLVKLPDHDWVVAERHKLIPSVYGIMQIKPKMLGDFHAVTYSGPTFISVRSGKHCSSTASSHGRDFDCLVQDEDFLTFTRNQSGEVKPVVIFIVDGGPDENPRYEKVIQNAIHTFKTHDLDTILIATNAPGRSAFNRVERRMAPLSRELCGVILEHDHFGSHLDEQGRTTDAELELENFQHAGETLAEIWSSVVIDGFSTKALYVSPDQGERTDIESANANWKKRHVRESHYFLQVSKCNDENCCRRRSTYLQVLPQFIPAPLYVDQKTMTASIEPEQGAEFSSLLVRLRINDEQYRDARNGEVPYDICCGSVKELLPSRTCDLCGMYFASIKSVKSHKRECKTSSHSALNDRPFGLPILSQRRNNRPVRVAARRQQERMVIWSSRLNDQHVDWFDEEDLADVEVEQPVEPVLPGVRIFDIANHMRIPWEDA